ncbi:MAG: shikimate dehydrogenase family protein [Candidatus Dormibacteria bacterium]
MAVVALVGEAVASSPSPAMHRAGFKAAGLDWDYVPRPLAKGELEPAWDELARTFRGLNVTNPHKQVAARLADRLSPAARRCGSVNTVRFDRGSTFGDSTDGAGFMAALAHLSAGAPPVCAVLGTGGAARAVAASLLLAGSEVRLLGRSEEAAGQLQRALHGLRPGSLRFWGWGAEQLQAALRGCRLLVNATSVGGPGAPHVSPLPGQVRLAPEVAVFDLVYAREPTPLVRLAQAWGCPAQDGLEMLVEQGLRSFRVWTGRRAPATVMRQAARRALGRAA